ncbi:SRR1-domain-containing protein [Lentinula aciculospora]|uniref:SRR1-domain-containing protein n=1 Tax=Lentinula aciculospora TaxID=153920 RepID=A0A9W9ABV8_9AGAR|nr:SRR1-domain-containing protein [Lentinula aciculospora]
MTTIWQSSSNKRKARKQHGRQQKSLFSRIEYVQDKLDSTWLHSCTQILKSCFDNRMLELSGNARQENEGQKYTVTCLGLGSPETSDNARAQLAFLLKTCDCFNIQNYTKISIYDPVFTEEDKLLFVQLGICVMDPRETHQFNATVEEPTILYMPHCDLALYEDVLTANWSLERLGNILFICNHFDDYIQKLVCGSPCPPLSSSHFALVTVAPHITSLPLPPSPDWPGAFNNISAQFMSKNKLDTGWLKKEPEGKERSTCKPQS